MNWRSEVDRYVGPIAALIILLWGASAHAQSTADEAAESTPALEDTAGHGAEAAEDEASFWDNNLIRE